MMSWIVWYWKVTVIRWNFIAYGKNPIRKRKFRSFSYKSFTNWISYRRNQRIISYEDIILDTERELDQKEANRKHKMMINQTVSIGILKNDLIYILLETDDQKKNILFQQIYEDISKNLVPIRPDRHYIRTNGRLAGKYSNTHKRAYWAKKYEYKEKGIRMPI